MGEYSYILEQQGKSTSEKLAEFTAAIGWRDELATYRIIQAEYEMRAAAAAEQGISLLDDPPYTAEELVTLDAESATYYDAFAANYVATAAFTGRGSGTAEDPYIITNRAELEAMADDLTAYYQLSNDINLGGHWSPWTPIGTSSAPFSGTLDGKGYVISGLYINGNFIRSGIFGDILGCNIYEVGVHSPVVILSSTATEGGYYGVIWGNVIDGDSSITRISQCYVMDATLTITTDVTGSVGILGGDGSGNDYTIVNNCFAVGSVSGPGSSKILGGICGTSSKTTNSYAVVDIIGTYIEAGGIAGNLYSTIDNCAVIDSTISSGTSVGRIGGDFTVVKPLINNYAGTDTTIGGSTVSGGTTTNLNGADVDPSTYHTQAFWENTLGWDFDTVWYWDSIANLPKLQAFLHGPKFPLNVEIGSPKYTTTSQINYSAGASASVQVTPTTSGTTPVSNSYYTFQSQDGQHLMTAYVDKWTNNEGTWTADIRWSSSNTDTLPAQSICWCVWTKEYYQSIIDRLSS